MQYSEFDGAKKVSNPTKNQRISGKMLCILSGTEDNGLRIKLISEVALLNISEYNIKFSKLFAKLSKDL